VQPQAQAPAPSEAEQPQVEAQAPSETDAVQPQAEAPAPSEAEQPQAEAPAPSEASAEQPQAEVRIEQPKPSDTGAFAVFSVALVKSLFHAATPTRNVERHLPRVLTALANQGLSDPAMTLVALATIRAESEGFAPISEGVSKYNTDPGAHPFNRYDHHPRLGNLGPPDGERFKGRGFVQLTGRDNYAKIGAMCGLGDQLLQDPDRANDPDIAALLLAGFLKRAEPEIRTALSGGDLRRVRRAVNGGEHGFDRFEDAWTKGVRALHL
jgi:peptidoglycan L-alanyl-D-glutamate endopeptidase CwlK